MKLTLYVYSILLRYGCIALATLVNNDFIQSVSWCRNHFLPRNNTPVRLSLETSRTNLFTLVITAGWLLEEWVLPFFTHVSFDTCQMSMYYTTRSASTASIIWHEESGKFLSMTQISTLKMLKGNRWTQTGQSINAIGFQLS